MQANNMKTNMFKRYVMKSTISIVCFLLVFFVASCKDIFEPDISGRNVVLVAPGDMVTTNSNSQTFWWEEVEDALNYDLQIVSPSFTATEKMIIDTTISTNKFMLTLYPGMFEWRVKAMNGSSQTLFSSRILTIDSTMDLTGQKVALLNPEANDFTNLESIILKWAAIYNATKYVIEVRSPDWNGANVINRGFITNDTIIVSNLPEGNYEWGVQALNNMGATSFYTRKFTIDRTVPVHPALENPADKATVNQKSVTLKWNRVTDNGSLLSDSLFVAVDSTFSASVIRLQQRVYADSAKFDGEAGNYFWRVKTVDAAGNKSDYNPLWRKFTIKIN
jgi:hypothetical protein